MTPNETDNATINGRISKARNAWVGNKRKIIIAKDLDTWLKINLFFALIGSILFYSLHVTKTNKSQLRKNTIILFKMYMGNNRREKWIHRWK